jgi:acyl dehydratase
MSTEEAPALSNVTYDELEVGRIVGPFAETVSADLAARLSGPIGEPHPTELAPPAVFPVLFLKALRRSMGGIPAGSVLAKQELEFHAPLAVGSEVQVTTWVSEKYVRRERPYVVVDFDIRESSGTQVLTGRKIIMWPTGPGQG